MGSHFMPRFFRCLATTASAARIATVAFSIQPTETALSARALPRGTAPASPCSHDYVSRIPRKRYERVTVHVIARVQFRLGDGYGIVLDASLEYSLSIPLLVTAVIAK